MMAGEGRLDGWTVGQSPKPVKVGFVGTPGDRFGPEKSGSQRPSPWWDTGKRVTARILLAGGWETMGPNQCRAKGLVVSVNGQSGGTQLPTRSRAGAGDGVPSELWPQESDRKDVRRRSRILGPFGGWGRPLFGHDEYLGRRIDDATGGLWLRQRTRQQQ